MIVSPVRRTIAVLIGAAALAAPGVIAGSPALASLPGTSSLLTRAPYLTDLTTQSVQVSWGTSAQFRGIVQYGPPGNCTAQSVTSSTLGSPITVNGVREYQNSVAVSPATAYCYRAIINLYLSQTGKLALRNNAGSVTTTSATAVPTGGWHKVVLHVIVNGAASSVDVSLDGATVADLALSGQNFGANPITSLQLGETTTGRTYDIAFDDVTVTQTPP